MNKRLMVLLCVAVWAAACSKKQDEAEARAQLEQALPPGPATLPTMEAPPLPVAPGPAQMSTVSPEFDVSSVAVSSVTLPPFPFFKDPQGLENDLKGADALRPFERQFFIAGDRMRALEGRLALMNYNIEAPASGRKYSSLEFHRNYENAILSLGGQKISAAPYSEALLTPAGGRDAVEKYLHGAVAVPDAETHCYLIRSADKEYWVYVSAGGQIPQQGYVRVLEKQAMQSALGFLDAQAMKKELDAKGSVTLYINFDTNKGSLRPDAQPIVAEIHKLLQAYPALKLSIEGHTDNVGSAEHNRQLSAERARSVQTALAALGVDAARLSARGFGADKPIADNASEAGRAKNRRVELVRIN